MVMKIQDLYKHLLTKHGKPQEQWELWCKRPKTNKEKELVMIGAVLTQNTNWKNVELAIANLKAKKLDSLNKIYGAGQKKIASLVRPAGFYNQKSGYLFNLAKFFVENDIKHKNLEQLRKELLEVKGIGPETADSILLYALEKPVFVIDEYTRRLVEKHKIAQNMCYAYLQKLFESNLDKDYKSYQDLHALIVIEGKKK